MKRGVRWVFADDGNVKRGMLACFEGTYSVAYCG